MNGKTAFSSEAVHSFVDELFGEDLHAKRVPSLAKATVGTLQASSLAVSAIGHGLALAQGGLSRHAIKQVDRMLSNDGIDVDALMADWAAIVSVAAPRSLSTRCGSTPELPSRSSG